MNFFIFFCVFFCVVSFVHGAACGSGFPTTQTLFSEFGLFLDYNESQCATLANDYYCTCSWLQATNVGEQAIRDALNEARQNPNATLACDEQSAHLPFCFYNRTLTSFVASKGICGNCGYGETPSDWGCMFDSCALQNTLIAGVVIAVLAVCGVLIYCFAINRKVNGRQNNFQEL